MDLGFPTALPDKLVILTDFTDNYHIKILLIRKNRNEKPQFQFSISKLNDMSTFSLKA